MDGNRRPPPPLPQPWALRAHARNGTALRSGLLVGPRLALVVVRASGTGAGSYRPEVGELWEVDFTGLPEAPAARALSVLVEPVTGRPSDFVPWFAVLLELDRSLPHDAVARLAARTAPVAQVRSADTGDGPIADPGTGLVLGIAAGPMVIPARELHSLVERVAPGRGGTRGRDPLSVPERERFCVHCGRPVGRSRATGPSRDEGFCPSCGARYSFSPRLATGDLAGGRYQVVGPLARGGTGWIYLARDTHAADQPIVVLKGLINGGGRAAALAGVERRFLTSLRHPDIVRMLDFVDHRDPVTGTYEPYLVMEHVQGPSLYEVIRAAREGRRPLLAEQAAAYCLQILGVLNHLHRQGLLYCDMKPDNVILTGGRIKVIDFGAVRLMGDDTSPVIGTRGYQAPETESSGGTPTVGSDIHTVGMTLLRLVEASTGVDRDGLAMAALRHVVDRAAAHDPGARFSSCEEMTRQLEGVLRQLLGERDGLARPRASHHFKGFDRAAPWLVNAREPHGWVEALPGPFPAADDPAAALLEMLGGIRPRELRGLLHGHAHADSPEIEFALCRAHAAAGEADPAADSLRRATVLTGVERAESDWRTHWHRGLVALADGEVGRARGCFRRVHAALPGEAVPHLAMGLCAQHAGELALAARYFEAVRRIGPVPYEMPAHYELQQAVREAESALRLGDHEDATREWGRAFALAALMRAPAPRAPEGIEVIDAETGVVRVRGTGRGAEGPDRTAGVAPAGVPYPTPGESVLAASRWDTTRAVPELADAEPVPPADERSGSGGHSIEVRLLPIALGDDLVLSSVDSRARSSVDSRARTSVARPHRGSLSRTRWGHGSRFRVSRAHRLSRPPSRFRHSVEALYRTGHEPAPGPLAGQECPGCGATDSVGPRFCEYCGFDCSEPLTEARVERLGEAPPTVGVPVTLGFTLAPAPHRTLTVPLAEPVKLRVLLAAGRLEISPVTQLVELRTDRTTETVVFDVVPVRPGSLALSFLVYLDRDGQLLQEVATGIEVGEPLPAGTAPEGA